MQGLLQRVERELNIPKEEIIQQGIKYFLHTELKNLSIEIKKICKKYGINSFDELWQNLESGKITESECFDDISKLEYLEIEREKISKILGRLS